ncbi:hypothetical protein BGZ73_000206, partial [Actinomortierella ambigua]
MSTATTTTLTLFCLVDGEATSNAFPVKVASDDSIGNLKDAIKAKKTPRFDDIAADELTLWCISIPVEDEKIPILLDNILNDKKKLSSPRMRVSTLFPESPGEETYILVQRPPPQGCGKTRAVIELLSQHWGFYFNASGMTGESINKYISRVRSCLEDDQSKLALDEHLSQEVVEMLFTKFVGRFRPAIAAVEKIVESNNPGKWKTTIDNAEDMLVSWANRSIKGNLCHEICRLSSKYNNHKDQLEDSIDNMLGLLMYQRCMFGNHDLVLKEVDPQLVEHAFGRIKIFSGHAVTVMDEPFVSKAVENYFTANDPYFAREVQKRMVKSPLIEQGLLFERFMMSVFSETFKTRPLSEWQHEPKISEMCPALVGTVEIVGWKEPGLEQGATPAMMSMEEFMNAHVNHGSIHNKMSVAPFFFPHFVPSGPDLVFFIRIDGVRLVPVFVQMKLHQASSTFSTREWSAALSTVPASKIEGHVKTFRNYCPDNIYISMIIAYPTKWTDKLPAPSELPQDLSAVQQVVISIGDDNFGNIFPKEHVEFIDRLKDAPRGSVDNSKSKTSTVPKAEEK